MAHYIVGTAGHIDHGKSALVERLTGANPDRLREEQQRGMTIDLGFAFLNEEVAFIDVPGHEKFVKNMVAGAGTVDAAVLVIAADDGVMPQTREHFDVLRLLGIEHGLIALTKIDLVDDEWAELVEEDIRRLTAGSFLQDAPIIRLSSVTGRGIETLQRAILELIREPKTRRDQGAFWMPVDRSFSIKGHGTVVTGSVLSGTVRLGEMLQLLPRQTVLKVRGLQTHGHSVDQVQFGDRAAINLAGVSKDDIIRGDVLAQPHQFEPSGLLDATLYLLPTASKPLKNRTRVRLHLGAREVMARIKIIGSEQIEPGTEATIQLFTEKPVAARRQDAFVIRQYSPPLTIGGGRILQPQTRVRRRFRTADVEEMRALMRQNPREMILAKLQQTSPLSQKEIQQQTGLDDVQIQVLDELTQAGSVVQLGQTFVAATWLQQQKEMLMLRLNQFHQKEPYRPGISYPELRNQSRLSREVFDVAVEDLLREGRLVREQQLLKTVDFEIKFSTEEKQLIEQLDTALAESGFNPPPPKILAQQLGVSPEKIRHGLEILLSLGKMIRLTPDIFYRVKEIHKIESILESLGENDAEISVGALREALQSSRKYVVPLLEYFDTRGITERLGDVRMLVKRENHG